MAAPPSDLNLMNYPLPDRTLLKSIQKRDTRFDPSTRFINTFPKYM